ncbi:hypothetical protein C8N40_103335 [Pontibacter mucosus]|uniref:Uncharacterized protein n=1 Tax=Pontibacter mucosus TaxID=1649266 RepID=A0A2T5YLR2_9BACT|nr:hypothetical protein [Pontibacter mucosus]PTX20258.1 hypothetical protein C8N40_103335 [Pontibacter mucosus]
MTHKKPLFILSLALLSASLVSCKPACPIGPCQVRMEHIHGDTEYRGQPIWKKQNPRVGEKLDKVSQEKQHVGRSKAKNKE